METIELKLFQMIPKRILKLCFLSHESLGAFFFAISKTR